MTSGTSDIQDTDIQDIRHPGHQTSRTSDIQDIRHPGHQTFRTGNFWPKNGFEKTVLDVWCPGCLMSWMSDVLDVWCPGCLMSRMSDVLDVWCPGCLMSLFGPRCSFISDDLVFLVHFCASNIICWQSVWNSFSRTLFSIWNIALFAVSV